jgi:PKD repeat protein
VNLSVRTTSGLQQSTTRTIVVRAPVLQARILASRLSGFAPLSVAFDASPSTGSLQSYVWNFGDGAQNDGKQTEHTFTQPGTYTVELTVTDTANRTSTSTITISVQ